MTSDNGVTFKSYVQTLPIRTFTISQNNLESDDVIIDGTNGCVMVI